MPEGYINIAIKRQAILERLKTGQVKNYAAEIGKIERLMRRTIGGLDEELSALSRTKLNNLLALLQKDQAAIFTGATEAFLKESADIAAVYMSQELLDLRNTVDLRGTKLDAFTKKEVFAKVIKRPLATEGALLEPWLKDFSTREISRTSNAIRLGHSQGLTNQQMVQKLVGTKSRNFRDGILQTTRRNASTVVRTSVQHVASAARQEVWEANKDVVKRYKFIATLDTDTSKICRSLDQQEFEFGEGPIPPVHPNCRSTTIPVLNDKFKFLSKGRTRSSADGPVGANSTYYGWLRNQDAATKREVLGPVRAKLFDKGGLTAERFRELQFDKTFTPLTLKEMRKLEPKAFEMAGL